ncbi:MAG: NRAMP family divalent metal transporter [Vulcanimicrobiaceae bacterium]
MSKKDGRPWWRSIGPGIISGTSDNDPTTVASLAVIGSTTVFGLLWLVVLIIPMLAVVQALSAFVGVTCKDGLEDFVRKRYGLLWATIVVAAVLAVNVLTLSADIEAGGAAVQLITNVDYRWFVPLIAGGSAAILVWGSYERIKRVLMYISLVFFAYAAAAVLAHPDWHAVLRASFVPHFEWSDAYVDGAIAMLGTTLTAYAYVWETIEIHQEKPPLKRLGLVQVDSVLGTVVAGISFWCITVATGATLGAHHHQVQTAQDAARALQPLAGRWASVLFGAGLIASSLLAVPVLAATAAYMLKELFHWRGRIGSAFWDAPQFNVAVIGLLVFAVLVALAGFPAIKLLFIASIAGGIATPITLVFLILAASDKKATRGRVPNRVILVASWCTAAIVTIAAALFLVRTLT